MKPWNHDQFRLDTLASGQVVGRFPALEALEGFAHLVTTQSCGDFGPAHHGKDPAAMGFVTSTLGVDGAAWSEHVHGTTVLRADSAGRAGAGDGTVTDRPGLAVMAFSADCVDMLVADPVRRAVGAIHAGAVGTIARGASGLVRAMVESFNCRPGDLVACICPSIGPCCFYANQEWADTARANYGPLTEQFLLPRRKDLAFDLWRANALDFESAGVAPANIHAAGLCTSCHNELFFSHQYTFLKTGQKGGTFCSAIALVEPH
jgi:hypothetical protein